MHLSILIQYLRPKMTTGKKFAYFVAKNLMRERELIFPRNIFQRFLRSMILVGHFDLELTPNETNRFREH